MASRQETVSLSDLSDVPAEKPETVSLSDLFDVPQEKIPPAGLPKPLAPPGTYGPKPPYAPVPPPARRDPMAEEPQRFSGVSATGGVAQRRSYGGSAQGITMPESVRVTGPADIELPHQAAPPQQPTQAPPPLQPRRITAPSQDGLNRLKDREGGFQEEAYQDHGGPAIGYGMHTYRGQPVKMGMTTTEDEADAELAYQAATTYVPAFKNALKVPVTQHQFDALTSMAWNAPTAARRIAEKLTAGTPITQKDFEASATSGGKPNKGLL